MFDCTLSTARCTGYLETHGTKLQDATLREQINKKCGIQFSRRIPRFRDNRSRSCLKYARDLPRTPSTYARAARTNSNSISSRTAARTRNLHSTAFARFFEKNRVVDSPISSAPVALIVTIYLLNRRRTFSEPILVQCSISTNTDDIK